MGLPKEPRQKMINMMYLVLTALLALNVTSEVLNAFKTVNNSLLKSTGVINDKNTDIYNSLAEKAKDPQTAAKAAPWVPRAEKVKQMAAEMGTYIEELKTSMKKGSGLEIIDGVEHFKEDNLDAPTRLMDQEGKGKQLYDKLTGFKKSVIEVLDPNAEEWKDNPKMQEDLKKAQEAFQKTLPIDMNVPKSQTGSQLSNDAKGWTQNYFHMTPTIAAVTILSKFQNDVKNTESQMIDYLHSQIGQVKVVFDQFQALAQASSNYVMPGDDLEIMAGVGAFSAAAKPTITINGQNIPVGTDGTALWKTKVTGGAGSKNVPVRIQFTKPDGSLAVVDKVVKYDVGMPSGASIFLEKMNVMYVGVDNPLTISGGSVGAEKVRVVFPGGSISKAGGDHYIAKPAAAGMSEIQVIAEGKPFKFPLRLKLLPNPAGFVGASKGGRISTAAFKAQGGLIARLEDSEFEAPFRVVSYTLAASGGAFPNYTPANNEGNRWTGNAKGIVDRATPGTTIFFDDINVVGPDGKTRRITPMVFQLQ